MITYKLRSILDIIHKNCVNLCKLMFWISFFKHSNYFRKKFPQTSHMPLLMYD